MLDRLILSAVLGVTSLNNLYPAEPEPLTSAQFREKAKQTSVSEMCKKNTKSSTAKDLCKRWGKHNA